MSIRFSSWAFTALAGLISFDSIADTAVDKHEPKRVVSISVGLADTSGSYADATNTPVRNVDLDYASSPAFSVAWGIEEGHGRVMLEYYRTDVEVESPPFATSGDTPELQIQSLFYSGYWSPDIYWGIKGILGAGVGYSQLALDNTRFGKLDDGGLSFKASLGLEYALFKNLTVYVLGEVLRFADTKDYVTYPSIGEIAGGTAERSMDGNEQTRLALGINLRY